MTIFGIGPFELLIIIVIAMVVVGPERLPEMMYQIGHAANRLKRLVIDLRNQARNELGDDYEAIQQMSRQIRELDPRRQIQELSRSLLEEPVTKIDLGPPPPPASPPEILRVADLARDVLADDLLDAPLRESLAPAPNDATGESL